MRRKHPRPARLMRANSPTTLRMATRLDSAQANHYNPALSTFARELRAGAQVAQLVEHVTENHGVGGSIPPLGTIHFSSS